MPHISFTQNIQRHVTCPPAGISASTVREALDNVFATNPTARRYILDDDGSLRRHMSIFVNGEPIKDRKRLSDPVSNDSEVYVMQALSGG